MAEDAGAQLESQSNKCPIVFEPEDVRATRELDAQLSSAEKNLAILENAFGLGSEGWVPVHLYESARERCRELKERELVAEDIGEEERAQIDAHWLFDDMDEQEYL